MSKQTTLLLVGRSGSGKSSVGNSILGKQEAFKPSGMREEIMLSNDIASDDKFFVVDCSGVGDTGSDMVGDVKDVVLNARKALEGKKNETKKECSGFEIVESESNPTEKEDLNASSSSLVSEATHSTSNNQQEMNNGSIADNKVSFDVLIFVMKYGARFTKQEKDAVQMVKSIFGENVFREWGILVFSYGDNFYLDTKDDGMTFEAWCREQTGDIKVLFEEVNYRCVIFDNKSTNKEKELGNLKGNIDKITKHGHPYTLENFDNAKKERVKKHLNYPYGGLQAETDHLLIKSNQLMQQSPPDYEQLREKLYDLLQHVKKLITLDEGTGVLKPLLEHVDEQIATLEAKTKQLESSVDERTYYGAVWQYLMSWIWPPLEIIRSTIARGIAMVSPAPNSPKDTDVMT